jgi:hypothetical protein
MDWADTLGRGKIGKSSFLEGGFLVCMAVLSLKKMVSRYVTTLQISNI